MRHYPPDSGQLYREADPVCRRELFPAWMKLTLCLSVALACFLVAAHEHSENLKLRRDAVRQHHRQRATSRGELWLRCPGSTTWRSYTGADVSTIGPDDNPQPEEDQ